MKLVKNSISTKAKISSSPKKPKSLYCLEAGLDHIPCIQLLPRYRDKLEKMTPKIMFIVLPFSLLSTKGQILPCESQGKYSIINAVKEGTKSTLITYNQRVTNCAAVRNSNVLNKHCTTDHFINTIALLYCFANLFFLLIYIT